MHSAAWAVLLLGLATSVISTFVPGSAQCITYGETACPYTPATTSDLQNLASQLCNIPNNDWEEQLDADLPGEGYYTVAYTPLIEPSVSDCIAAFNEVIAYCDAEGFWIQAQGAVEIKGYSVTFSVVNCQLA